MRRKPKSLKPELARYQQIFAQTMDEHCVSITRRQNELISAMIDPLRWGTRWDFDGVQNPDFDAIEAMIDDLQYRLDLGWKDQSNCAELGGDDCPDCVIYDFSSDSIEGMIDFYPISPFSGAWFPEFPYIANPWNIAQVPEVGGIEPNDLLISVSAFFISTFNPLTFVDKLPAIAFWATGADTVTLTLIERAQGGFGFLSVDGQIQEFIDLQSFQLGELEAYIDVLEDYYGALTGTELLGEVFSVEIKMPDRGAHRIALTFVPRILIGIPPLGIGGGIRSIEMCGENPQMSVLPDWRINDCILEVKKAPNLDWEPLGNVCGEDAPIPVFAFEGTTLTIDSDADGTVDVTSPDLKGADGADGANGADGADGADGIDGECPDCDTPTVGGAPVDRDGNGALIVDAVCGGANAIVDALVIGWGALENYYTTNPTPTLDGVIDAWLNSMANLNGIFADKYRGAGMNSVFADWNTNMNPAGSLSNLSGWVTRLQNASDDIRDEFHCAMIEHDGLNSADFQAMLTTFNNDYLPPFGINIAYMMPYAMAVEIYADGALRSPLASCNCQGVPTPTGATWGHSWDLSVANVDVEINAGTQTATGVAAVNGVVRLNISPDNSTTNQITHAWVHMTEKRDPADTGSTPDSSDRVRVFIGATEMLLELFPDILDPLYAFDPTEELGGNYMQIETRYQYFGSPSEDYEHTELQIYGTGTKPTFIDGTNLVLS